MCSIASRCGGHRRRDEPAGEACDNVLETPGAACARTLTSGPVGGRQLLHPIKRAQAPERERVRAAHVHQPVERLSID